MKIDKKLALDYLHNIAPDSTFDLLGEGKSSYIYTNYTHVFKILSDTKNIQVLNHISNNKIFNHCQTLYQLDKIIQLDNAVIITYPYEKGEVCQFLEKEELLNFLVECWQCQIVFRDIKPDNFIRVGQQLRFIDYEPDFYTDNLFLNMAARAFIYSQYATHDTIWLKKLCRTAINQFNIPELTGFQMFTNELFGKIIFAESYKKFPSATQNLNTQPIKLDQINHGEKYTILYNDFINPENIFWDLLTQHIYLDEVEFHNIYFGSSLCPTPHQLTLKTSAILPPSQPVSLVIKACVQDAHIIYQAIKHIIRQLATPNSFYEKILALDIRQDDFLRSYHTGNTWEDLIQIAESLKQNGIIDKYIYPNHDSILATNLKWFNIASTESHTTQKVPVGAQLFAFDQAACDYILQVDCDVMIGRLDNKHAYLQDMINTMEADNHILSIGFNIYKGQETFFTPYFGTNEGGFVPEVRFCLLKKSRIYAILPMQNEILPDGLKLSWYRALEIHQKQTNTYSLRGGDSRSFYTHIQNFKKADNDMWFTILDRIEQLQIPDCQQNEFDLMGSYYDWGTPNRSEEIVIISCLHNISLPRFLRYWYALISQTYQDWGLILIDDASDNGLSHHIHHLIKPFRSKITFIHNKFRIGVAENTYKAIHYFAHNQNSIICIIDGDDALIGQNALDQVIQKYKIAGADVVIGNMYRTDKITAHYQYMPNFSNPRLYGGNVWQHIRTFRKYLFDSLQLSDLKIPSSTNDNMDDILLSKRFSKSMKFPEYCWDFTYMIPIIEMSSNPMWIESFNILHDRTTLNTPAIKQQKEHIIATILAKPAKTPDDIVGERKRFLPNLSKIEIDITYQCNLKCINCNRSSTQAPTQKGISMEKIFQFIQESIQLQKRWKLINILGGEPTLHPHFLEIVTLILTEYIDAHSPHTTLQITSNGYGNTVQAILAKLPSHPNLIIDNASYKDNKVIPYFSPFNNAPIDNQVIPQNQDYSKGCWVTAYCGIGLNELGYYPCGVAGGIDRVFEFNLGIPSLHDTASKLDELLNTFCRYCGNFNDYAINKGDFIPRHEKAALTQPIISKSWQQQYRKYNGKK